MSSSQFTEALSAQVIAGLDPMNGMVRALYGQQIKTSEIQLDESRLDIMDKLANRIADSQKASADPKVIAAYQSMMDKYTS